MAYQLSLFEIEPESNGLTSSPADSLASPFPWLESKKVKGMTVTYGHKCLELSENLRRIGLSVRMYLESCQLPGTQFARTWSVKVTTSSRLCLKLRLSVRRTGGSECFLWATPNSMDSLPQRSYAAMKRQAASGGRKNRTRPSNLREQVDPLMCQAYTDARMEANALLPTPTVNGNHNRKGVSAKSGDGLATAMGGQLNPDWVCWMMGFPPGWLDV